MNVDKMIMYAYLLGRADGSYDMWKNPNDANFCPEAQEMDVAFFAADSNDVDVSYVWEIKRRVKEEVLGD